MFYSQTRYAGVPLLPKIWSSGWEAPFRVVPAIQS